MKEKVLKRLEEMAENPEGILPVCCIENCDKIKIVFDPKSDFYWVNKKDFPNPQMYYLILESYHQLGIDNNYTQGLSHTYCPEDFKIFMAEFE